MGEQHSKNRVSRREFLRQASFLAGAAALAGCVAPTPQVVKETVEVEKVATAAPAVLKPATLNI